MLNSQRRVEMAKNWATEANILYADIKSDIDKLKEKMLKLKKVIIEHDEVDETENPFLVIIDGGMKSLDYFTGQFETV
jgi:hypothetical protein